MPRRLDRFLLFLLRAFLFNLQLRLVLLPGFGSAETGLQDPVLPLAVGQHRGFLLNAEEKGLRGLLRTAALQLRKHDTEQKSRVQTADLTAGLGARQQGLQKGQIPVRDHQHGAGEQFRKAGRQALRPQDRRRVPHRDGLRIQIGMGAVNDLPPLDTQHAEAADRIRLRIRPAGLQTQYQVVLQLSKLVKRGKTGEAEHLCSLPFFLSNAHNTPPRRDRGRGEETWIVSFSLLYRIAAPGSITEMFPPAPERENSCAVFVCVNCFP